MQICYMFTWYNLKYVFFSQGKPTPVTHSSHNQNQPTQPTLCIVPPRAEDFGRLLMQGKIPTFSRLQYTETGHVVILNFLRISYSMIERNE